MYGPCCSREEAAGQSPEEGSFLVQGVQHLCEELCHTSITLGQMWTLQQMVIVCVKKRVLSLVTNKRTDASMPPDICCELLLVG